jgi:hypothetical protein
VPWLQRWRAGGAEGVAGWRAAAAHLLRAAADDVAQGYAEAAPVQVLHAQRGAAQRVRQAEACWVHKLVDLRGAGVLHSCCCSAVRRSRCACLIECTAPAPRASHVRFSWLQAAILAALGGSASVPGPVAPVGESPRPQARRLWRAAAVAPGTLGTRVLAQHRPAECRG